MEGKKYKLSAGSNEDLVAKMGYCLASDKITVDGLPVGYMYREEPEEEDDSGWRFLSGTEEQDYVDNPENSGIFEVNTIANYDKAIVYYLKMPYGTEMERIPGEDKFRKITNNE